MYVVDQLAAHSGLPSEADGGSTGSPKVATLNTKSVKAKGCIWDDAHACLEQACLGCHMPTYPVCCRLLISAECCNSPQRDRLAGCTPYRPAQDATKQHIRHHARHHKTCAQLWSEVASKGPGPGQSNRLRTQVWKNAW